jgi:hypothetical protein
MRTVLAAERDAALVVLSGDIVSGYAWNKSTRPFYEPLWRRVADLLEGPDGGPPYAAVLGAPALHSRTAPAAAAAALFVRRKRRRRRAPHGR